MSIVTGLDEYLACQVLFSAEWEEKTGMVSGFISFLNKANGGNVELNRITVRDGTMREGGFYYNIHAATKINCNNSGNKI